MHYAYLAPKEPPAPYDPSRALKTGHCRALSRRLEITVRRHMFNKDSLSRFLEWSQVRLLASEVPLNCKANVTHTRQSRPDYGIVFQVKVLKTVHHVPSWLGCGLQAPPAWWATLSNFPCPWRDNLY